MSALVDNVGLKPVPPDLLRPVEPSALSLQDPSSIEHAKLLLGQLQRQVEALQKEKDRENSRFSFFYEELKAKSEAEIAMRDRQLEDLRRRQQANGTHEFNASYSERLEEERSKNRDLQERLQAAMLVVSNEGTHLQQLKEAEVQGKMLNEEIASLKKELSDMQVRLVQSQNTFFELQNSQSVLQRNLKDKLEASQNENARLQKEVADLQKVKEENSMLNHQLALLNKNIVERKSEETTTEYNKMKEELSAMLAAKEKVEEDNKSLRDSVATLHVAINETKKEHEGVRVKLQNNIETLEKEVEKLKAEKNSKASLMEELLEVKNANTNFRKQIENFEKQVRGYEQLSEKLREEVDMSNMYKESYFKDQKIIEQQRKEMEYVRKSLQTLSDENKKLESDIHALNHLLDKHRNLQSDMDRLNKSYETLADKYKLVEQTRRELEEEKQSLVGSLATACKLYEAKEMTLRRELRELKEVKEQEVRSLQDKIASADGKVLLHQAEIYKLHNELQLVRSTNSTLADQNSQLESMLATQGTGEQTSGSNRNNSSLMSSDRTRIHVSVNQSAPVLLAPKEEDAELEQQLAAIRDGIDRIRTSVSSRSRFFDHNNRDSSHHSGRSCTASSSSSSSPHPKPLHPILSRLLRSPSPFCPFLPHLLSSSRLPPLLTCCSCSLNGTFCRDDALGSRS